MCNTTVDWKTTHTTPAVKSPVPVAYWAKRICSHLVVFFLPCICTFVLVCIAICLCVAQNPSYQFGLNSPSTTLALSECVVLHLSSFSSGVPGGSFDPIEMMSVGMSPTNL